MRHQELLSGLIRLHILHHAAEHAAAQAVMRGTNAAVVGLLGAALYDPVWTSAILSSADFGLALAAFVLLTAWKAPPWIFVLFTALGGTVLAVL